MKFLLPTCIIASLFLGSCAPNLSEDKVKQLDTLAMRVDSLGNQLTTYDSLAISKSSIQFYDNYEFISSEMKDTIEPKTAFMLDQYFALKKAFNYYHQNYSQAKFQIAEEKEQLDDLKKDIENGLIEEKQLTKYLALEKENLSVIENTTTTLNTAVTSINTLFLDMNPAVDSLITAFKKGKSE
jgi:hypothetical protein